MHRPRFALSLPSDLRMLSVARAFVEAAARVCELETCVSRALQFAIGEAVTNIVRHAHRERADAEMQIVLEIQADGVELVFLDQGEPFDLAAVPCLPPGELRIGGRGVYLLRTVMDELTCGPRGDRPGNRLRMFKRRPAANRTAG